MRKSLLFFLVVLLSSFLGAQDIPHMISYQGKLYENENPVSGSKNIEFRIGAWSELHENVQITGGLYSVTLGSVTPLPVTVFDNPAGLNLDVWIDGVQLTPNTSLVSVPYSYKAEIAADTRSIGGREVSFQEPINGQVLKWNGTAWIPGDDELGSATGIAGGDLSGSFPDPTVSKIAGMTVSGNAPVTGQVLKWDGSQWIAQNDNEGSLTGAAGGDLSGTFPNPTVSKISGNSVSSTIPTSGQVLKWNGTAWEPGNDNEGGLTGTAGGDLIGTYPNPSIKDGAITNAKIVDGTITLADLAFLPVTNPYSGDLTISGSIITGTPTSSFGNLDIVSNSDIYADYDIIAGDDVLVNDQLEVGDDIFLTDDIYMNDNGARDGEIFMNYGAEIRYEDPSGSWAGTIRGIEDQVLEIEVAKGVEFFGINGNTTINNLGDFYAAGNISCGGTKYFVQDHPKNNNEKIYYACLEGGEAGTYIRGSSTLVNGKAIIDIPEHFSLVTNESGLTAQVTPRGDCSGIYVVSVTPRQLVVKELMKGKSNAEFDYFIQGIRTGYEDYKIIREKEN